MLGAVEAAHAGIGLGPDDEIEWVETELQGGRNDSRITPPIDESGKKTAVAKVTEGGTDPGSVKCPEFGISHLAAGHQKLAVHSARHVAGNGTVEVVAKEADIVCVQSKHAGWPNRRCAR